VAPPRCERLGIPAEYGSPSTLLDWAAVDQRLTEAKHYWLATVRPDGRPHAVPIDGLWLDSRLWFGGVPGTLWQRALRAHPAVTVHLEDTTAATIVEGTCEVVQPSRQAAEGLVAASKAKYGYELPVEIYLAGVWSLAPVKVMAWTDLTVDATRFVFG
jgi:hypothetical protein